jgi:DNA-binding NtrC family response regulator
LLLPLGATSPRPVDVRVLAATSKFGDAVRPDLRARLGSDPIEIPPLRERAEDIAALAAHFGGEGLRGLEPAAFRALHLYAWPLNVRELASAITRAVAIAGGEPVALEHLPKAVAAALQQGPPVAARRRYRTAPSKAELETLLHEQQGNVAAVAKSLDRQWSVVKKWLQRYKLRADRFRD